MEADKATREGDLEHAFGPVRADPESEVAYRAESKADQHGGAAEAGGADAGGSPDTEPMVLTMWMPTRGELSYPDRHPRGPPDAG